MTTIPLCATARWFFWLLNPFDCQPFTAEQFDLLTVGYFGDVVCKAMQCACIPQFQVTSNIVLVKQKNTKCSSCVYSGVFLNTACFYNSSGPFTGMSEECVIVWI